MSHRGSVPMQSKRGSDNLSPVDAAIWAAQELTKAVKACEKNLMDAGAATCPAERIALQRQVDRVVAFLGHR